MGLTRGNTEIFKVLDGQPLVANSLNSFDRGFPLGEAWTRLILRLNLIIVIGTGTGPISEGELNILKGLSFKTSRGEIPYNNVPGRALYRLCQIKSGTAPPKDAIAAGSATYRVQYDVWFIDLLLKRPEDFLLNTARYNRVQLDLNMGGLADLFTAPGTATLTMTVDVSVERTRGILPKSVWPKEYTEVGIVAPINPANQQVIDLERSNSLGFKRLLIQAADSASAGVPFSGTPSDTTLAYIGFDTDRGPLIDKIVWKLLNSMNKQEYCLETAIAGNILIDFCKDGSKMSSVAGGPYSRFRIQWDNGALSTSQISCLYDGMRPIIGV